MTKLAIIGPGLLGGSLALAARDLGGFRVSLWARRESAVDELRDLAIADEASTDIATVTDAADLVILCTPIGTMRELSERFASALLPTTLVTDVGSVKEIVVSQLEPVFRGRARFVGSHPMAGSEQTGIRAARADLFRGAACMVTPTPATDLAAVTEVTAFWERLGCRVREIAPRKHDELVAAISHLPHLVAAALVNAVSETNAEAFEMAGPGFRDTSRIAAGSPEMWTDILTTNRDAVRKSAEAMIAKLRQFITLLDRESPERENLMNQFLTQAKICRDSLPLRNQRHHEQP